MPDALTATVAAARAGDEEAFAELVRRFAPALYQYFAARGIQAHDAEDLVQESFLRVHRAFDRYDPRYAFSTWLYTIGRRLAANLYRRRGPVLAVDEERCADPVDPGETDPAAETIWARARDCLSPVHFETLWLFYGEGKPIAEIGRIMDCTRTNAKVRLHRARNRLAKAVKRAADPAVAPCPAMEGEP